jgi:gamma-glutamyl:cysteine ligase YbdK (ATP-grasp superfamily)
MTLHLFEGFGIELEYMIVDRATLDVAPIADALLGDAAGEDGAGDVERGATAWSNELVMHVLEMKTNGPSPTLEGLADLFAADVAAANQLLAPRGACLMPTAMHPWMDPRRETRLWPHEYTEVYRTYDAIFDCRGHGWSNLQSMHVNLPFTGDDELWRLHSAIRVVLPLLPALAASSPFVEGQSTGILDNRLQYYRTNSRRIPSVTGRVVPEVIHGEAEYRATILEPIWADTAPLDPDGVLRGEFANARGAIARFDRGAVEIRVLDLQEHPRFDLAIAALVSGVVRALAEQDPEARAAQDALETDALHAVFLATMLEGEAAIVTDTALLAALGLGDARRLRAGEVWAALVERVAPSLPPALAEDARALVRRGTLARRLLRAVGPHVRRERLAEVYRALVDGLARGDAFEP